MLESEPESPVEKNFPQPKIGSKRSDLGSYDISTNCDLAGISWVIPDSVDSDHAELVTTVGGPSWVASIVKAVGNSKCKNADGSSYWNSTGDPHHLGRLGRLVRS